MTYGCCPVCSKRFGEYAACENAEMLFERCEKHTNTLSTAQIYAKGLTVGQYNHQQAMDRIGARRPVGRPLKSDTKVV